jgi:hypothetical protein
MDYTKELTIFKGQKKWQTPSETGNYKVRVISKPQPVKLTHIDDTGTSPGITVISRENDEVRPMLDIKNDVVIDKFQVVK